MKFKNLTYVFILVTLWPLVMTASAQEDPKQAFLARLKEKNKNVQSIESDFIQERTIAMMEEVLRSSGKFYYKKPGMLKWDQQQPSPYYLIISGDHVVRFDGKKKKEMAANSPQVVYFKNFIMGTVDGSLFESNQFQSTFEERDSETIITLHPQHKSMQKRFRSIELIFDSESLMLKKIVIHEPGDDTMVLIFLNQKFNTLKDDSVFIAS